MLGKHRHGNEKKAPQNGHLTNGGTTRHAANMAFGAEEGANACFKVVLLGEGAVGKSSILLRYTEDKFNNKHLSTVQAAFAIKQVPYNSNTVELQIWDTAGQEKFHSLSPIYYRNSNGALLVYDIMDEASFVRVKNWINELRQMLGDGVCILIAGNKLDLSQTRTVTEEAAKSFAQSVGVPYRECSAKENLGVDELFDELIQMMFKKFGANNTENDVMMQREGGGLRRSNSRRSVRIVDDSPVPPKGRKCC